MFGIVSGEARRLPTTPAGRSPWVDRLLLALALSVVTALLASIALAVVNLLPSSAPAQQPVQAEVNIPAVVPAAVDVPNSPAQDATPKSIPAQTEQAQTAILQVRGWKFVRVWAFQDRTLPLIPEDATVLEDLRPFRLFRDPRDGSFHRLYGTEDAEVIRSTLSRATEYLGLSIDGEVLWRNGTGSVIELSVNKGGRWLSLEGLPEETLIEETNSWDANRVFRNKDSIIIYASHRYFPEGGISGQKLYRAEIPLNDIEGLSP